MAASYTPSKNKIMAPQHDVIIIGGGIVGLAVARELAQFQLNILLLEKEIEVGFGVSKSNSGIIHTGFQAHHNTLKAKLAVRGNKLYTKMAKNLDFPLQKTGELIVAFTETEKNKLKEIQQNGKKLGIPQTMIVDENWLKANEPKLSGNIKYALLAKTAGIINPYEAVYAMAENVLSNGVKIKCNEKVTAIKLLKESWQVKTQNKTYTSKIVVNAAGLFADNISKLAGIDCENTFPRKGEEFLLDKHVGKLSQRIIFPVPQKLTKGILIIPTIDGNYMIGPTAEDILDKEDLRTSKTGKEFVVKKVKKIVPSIKEDSIIASFAGLRPATTSGDFHIQEDKNGFINLIGIQSPGLTAAPAIAEEVREIICGSLTLKPKQNYQEKRKAIIRFRELNHRERLALIKKNPDYGEIVCRCELVTKGEIIEAIQRGARTMDGLKFRTRSQMGRCHGAFCTMKIMHILHQQLGSDYQQITKRGEGSHLAMDQL
ncbi:NAD(P)/FAD-dependent oxidoreductase [Candidatus Margulisiibacteriota bacterium]